MKSILDSSFRYVPSVHTDLRKTFARVRREQRKKHRATSETGVRFETNVVLIQQRKP